MQVAQIGLAQVVRIRLKRPFGFVVNTVQSVDLAKDLLELARGKQRRGPSAKVDCVDSLVSGPHRSKSQLAAERVDVFRYQVLQIGIGIESAITASNGAERDMDID